MMRRGLLGFYCGLLISSVSAQNLVPNPDFELYSQCPDFLAQMSRALDWQNFRGSPDYFNACDIVEFVGVPRNVWGFQQAASGIAYAGLMTLEDGDFENIREYLGVHLSSPLVPGIPVYLSFKTVPAVNVLGNGPGNQLRPQLTCEGIGMRFSMTSFYENNNDPLPNSAAIHLSAPLTDTLNWITVSGMYVPDSAYQWLVLGNFFSDALISHIVLEPTGTWPGAYAYVDEVCVSYDPSYCPVFSGVSESASVLMNVWPNPCTTSASVSFSRANHTPIGLQLVDETSRVCWTGILPPGSSRLEVDMTALSSGAYILQSTDPDQLIKPTRLILLR